MKLSYILAEAFFKTYVAIIKVKYEGEVPTRIAELIRALPGVTTVTLINHNEYNNFLTCRVKLLTQKTGEEAFHAMKKNAMKRYSEIKGMTVVKETIELKKK